MRTQRQSAKLAPRSREIAPLLRAANIYAQNPAVRGLVAALASVAWPVAIADPVIVSCVRAAIEKRDRAWIEELDSQGAISEILLQDPDFVHEAALSLAAARKCRSTDKARLFARLLSNCARGIPEATADDYERHFHVLEALTVVEFRMLLLLRSFEQSADARGLFKHGPSRRLLAARTFWDEFKQQATAQTGIPEDQIEGVLEAVKRTGLYRGHVVGNLDPATGQLTPNFVAFAASVADHSAEVASCVARVRDTTAAAQD